MQMANLLVGNAANDAVLEMTLLGPELHFSADALVAVCGASMTPIIDNQPAAAQRAVYPRRATSALCACTPVDAEHIWQFQAGLMCRAYWVAAQPIRWVRWEVFRGVGWQRVTRSMFTRSTTCVPTGKGTPFPTRYCRCWRNPSPLRLVPGLYIHRLTTAAVDTFFADSWHVSTEADRTGYRLKGGQPLAFTPRTPPFGAGSDPSNIVDACYPIGSVQVPGGLEPIVLLRDAVSGGGYMTLGTVISPDLAILGQLQPNQHVRFMPVTLDEALVARRQSQQRLAQLANVLR